MVCEHCYKEFLEDWRRDKNSIRRTPIPRFCSRACASARVPSASTNEKRRKRLKLLPLEIIDTKVLCQLGCGQPARYHSQSTDKYYCESSVNKCPAIRAKNSERLQKAYQEGRRERVFAPGAGNINHKEAIKRSHASQEARLASQPFEKMNATRRKKVLIKERGHQCEVCKSTMWLDNPITLQVHHKDGDRQHNQKNNLQLVCPNCHSYTETWCGRKGGSQKSTPEAVFQLALGKAASINDALVNLGMSGNGANYKRARRIARAAELYYLL